jgi:Ca2+/Na+ antiporter
MVGCSVGLENLCLDNLDANADGSVVGWGVLVEVLVLLYGFLAVAIIADNHLVTSLETLCVRWNVREDVAGASFMAFGSAAPEIIINAVSTIKTVLAVSDGGAAAVAPEDAGEDTDLGIGAIIGSGMIAFTVIPGVCGLAAKEDLALKRRPLARDTGFYSLALALLCYAISDGLVEVHEAAVMVTLYVVYIAIVVFSSGVRRRRTAQFRRRAIFVRNSARRK